MPKSSKTQLPKGWIKSGSHPDQYDMGYTEKVSHSGKGCGFVKSKVKNPSGTGTLMQGFNPGNYRKKRLQLTAWAKSKKVKEWAGIWFRVDSKEEMSIAFDNMKDRPIKGTTDWTQYKLVLDVPEDANNIAFGVIVVGTGTVWADDFEFKPVSKKTQLTDLNPVGPYYANENPTNLDFSDCQTN